MAELQALILDNLLALSVGIAVVISALLGFFLGRRRPAITDDEPEKKPKIEQIERPQSLFQRLTQGLSKSRAALTGALDGVFSRTNVDEELYEGLSDALIMADVGVKASERIIGKLKQDAKELKIKQPEQLRERLKLRLNEILIDETTMNEPGNDPLVILVVGVNGGGKTTTIGKLANHYKQKGHKVILGAGDTYRAGAIQQLTIWAERAGVDIVAHEEGADPAAVLFDTVSAAKARGCDVVICDTAGRLQNRKPLMDQLSKVIRVLGKAVPNAPHEVILVLDATIGQNALSQAKLFGEAATLTGLILTKLDGTAKGGVVIAVKQETNLPIRFIGVGEQMDDLRPFVPSDFVNALLGT